MKKPIVLTLLIYLLAFSANAQVTLDQTYYFKFQTGAATVVNLELSGKKYCVPHIPTNEIALYNLDYSLWKTIPIPNPNSLPWTCDGFVSEKLFNSDNLVEVMVQYNYGIRKIINETGAALDSFSNTGNVYLHTISPTVFKLMVHYKNDSVKIYSLPGTVPCDECGNGLGVATTNKKKKNILSDPAPNPSQREVRITYTLPDGTKQGVIDLYSTSGKKIKSYKVDNTFSYITLDNAELPAGVYYYNLIADGEVSITKKMVVIK